MVTFGIYMLVLVLLALLIASLMARGQDQGMSDVDVYKDQLAVLDRDIARGVIADQEAQGLRAEIARRLIAADRRAQKQGGTRGNLVFSGAVIIVAAIAAAAVYMFTLGAPGATDAPIAGRYEQAQAQRDTRPSQSEIEALIPPQTPAQADERLMTLVTQLRSVLENRPNDLEGHVLLARNEAGLGNFIAAYQAQERVLLIKGDAATADDFTLYGELLVLAVDGYISPRAEAAYLRALERDPENGLALYRIGEMFAQTGRLDRTFNIWKRLLEQGEESEIYMPTIRENIADMAVIAGVLDYELPAFKGPSAADIEAAAEMNETDRTTMIQNMVSGLASRLANEGGSASDWARLIGAYGVLGQTDNARAIWAEAQQVFADTPADLATIRVAAQQAGVVQ